VTLALIVLLQSNVLSLDGSFLFIFISILCLIFILNHTLFKPINAILEERERLGVGRIEEARQLLAKYDERLQAYEVQIRRARAEAYQQLEAQRRATLAARQELLTQVRNENAVQIAAAKSELARQVEVARHNLLTEARAMAATISTQILHRPVA
jgi:F-type H+-transporting ATPase subunit b